MDPGPRARGSSREGDPRTRHGTQKEQRNVNPRVTGHAGCIIEHEARHGGSMARRTWWLHPLDTTLRQAYGDLVVGCPPWRQGDGRVGGSGY